jgi:hypothetical protein
MAGFNGVLKGHAKVIAQSMVQHATHVGTTYPAIAKQILNAQQSHLC